MTADKKRAGNNSAPTVTDLIARIHSGDIDVSMITGEDRRRCVEHMTLEGVGVDELARIFKKDSRTIYRDLKAIRAANALEPSPEFTAQMIGQLVKEAHTNAGQIRREIRSPTVDTKLRIQGRVSIFEIYNELVRTLVKTSYIAAAPQQITATINHDVNLDVSLPELVQQMTALLQIEQNFGSGDPQLHEQLQQIAGFFEFLHEPSNNSDGDEGDTTNDCQSN